MVSFGEVRPTLPGSDIKKVPSSNLGGAVIKFSSVYLVLSLLVRLPLL